jgi:hypothetical protein
MFRKMNPNETNAHAVYAKTTAMYEFVITTGPTVNVKLGARKTWMLNRAIQDETRDRRATDRRDVARDCVFDIQAMKSPMGWATAH